MVRYRVPAVWLAASLAVSAVFILAGLVVLFHQPWSQLNGGDIFVTVFCVGAGCLGAAFQLTVHVTLTPREISYRANFRGKVIGWESVQSFQIVPDASPDHSWALVAGLTGRRGGAVDADFRPGA